nr:hypothetical protein GCM10020063_078120 [Dactylosporangium thailandense]
MTVVSTDASGSVHGRSGGGKQSRAQSASTVSGAASGPLRGVSSGGNGRHEDAVTAVAVVGVARAGKNDL